MVGKLTFIFVQWLSCYWYSDPPTQNGGPGIWVLFIVLRDLAPSCSSEYFLL